VRPRGRREGPSIALADIARDLAPDSMLLGDREPGLTAEGWFHADHMTYAYGVHIGVVRVDPETGHVAVERFLIGYDIGRAINPMMARGQLVGGFAQGLGGALYEEFLYDARGEPLCATLAEYALPNAGDVPSVEILLTEDAPSPLNPLGIKSVGEGGITGVGAALSAAIDEAIGMPGAVTELPATPRRIRILLRTARERNDG
jgi:aerobic carbon-monoxide dehydrogenase large subunit